MEQARQPGGVSILSGAFLCLLLLVGGSRAAAQQEQEIRVIRLGPDGQQLEVIQVEQQAIEVAPPASIAREKDAEASLQAAHDARTRQIEERLRGDPGWRSTHEEVAVIRVSSPSSPVSVNNFCLDREGRLLVCCGGSRFEYERDPATGTARPKVIHESPEVRIYGQDGERLGTWKVEAKPEAICVHTDGTIFVGGGGKVLRLDAQGKTLASAAAPALAPPPVETEVETTTEVEPKQKRPLVRAMLQALTGQEAEEQQSRAEAARTRAMELRKLAVTGIAVSDRDLFVACPAPKGYGYAVYRMTHDLTNPVLIVDRLRGCCSQMDIQSKDGELWVAENGRHKVHRYDRNGKVLASFGKRDRQKADCFGGCCEPKNLRFGPGGYLYACESGPPVAVKRFKPSGEFAGVVGVPRFSTGCVRVTTEVSSDGLRVFVLNTQGGQIHVLEDRRSQPTHKQIATIEIPQGDQPVEIHSFCVDAGGNLLAACGGERLVYTQGDNGMEINTVKEPSGIRVISPEGKPVAKWSLDITPQAINTGPDGSVYVGGQGKIARLDTNGKAVVVADSPQLEELPALPDVPSEDVQGELSPEEARSKQEKIDELQERIKLFQKGLMEAYEEVRKTEGDDEANASASARYEKVVEEYQGIAMELHELTTSPRQLAMEQRAAGMRKRAITGISVSDGDVFVACPAVKGYGYDVWRMDRNLANPVKIVQRLRGCCGQMDIQACGGKLYVAENGRHRVVCYDREGKQLHAWGKADREGVEGFGSCCNPMNLRFGPDGSLYTSEASLGRIKKFSPEGKFLGIVGKATIVPGCKHVAIGIGKGGNHVFLLDITRHRIAVLSRKEGAPVQLLGIEEPEEIIREF